MEWQSGKVDQSGPAALLALALARLPACAPTAEDMWKLKVPSGGGKDGRTRTAAGHSAWRARTDDMGQKAGGGGGGGAGRLP